MKRIGFLLVGLTLFGLCPSLSFSATETVDVTSTHAVTSPKLANEGEYVDVLVDYSGKGESEIFRCLYSDDCFFAPSTTYSNYLAKQSIGLALSAFHLYEEMPDESSEPSETFRSGALYSYFEDCGFDDIRVDDYLKETSIYTVGSAIGHKTISKGDETYELIAVGIRGGNYKNEWQSNLTLDAGFRHRGFDEAATLVTDRVLSYIGQQELNHPIKVWISGYSRAGAVANLVSANLNDSRTLSKFDVYCYTFAAPRPVWNDKKTDYVNDYNNIFNLVGASDFIPQFVPAEWDYCHYGIDKQLTGGEFDSRFVAKYDRIQESLSKRGVTTYYNMELNLRIRMLYGMLLEVAHNEFEFMEYLQPVILKILERKGINSLVQLLRETILQWSSSHPELADKKDAIIDFGIETLRPILFGGGYMEGQKSSAGNPVILFAHEHFPELYLYCLYELSEEEAFAPSSQFAYITLKGGKYTLVDKKANQEVMSIEGKTKTLTAYGEAQGLDLTIMDIKGAPVLVLPYDRDYELRYDLSEGASLQAYVQPYGNLFSSHLQKHVLAVNGSGPRSGVVLSLTGGAPTYQGTTSDSNPTEFIHHLGIQNGLMPYRIYVFVVGMALGLLLVALLWTLVLVQAKVAGRKVSYLRLIILSLFILFVLEGEMAFWFFADLMAVVLSCKIASSLLLLALYFIGKKPQDFKRLDKTILPFLVLACAANITWSVNLTAGLYLLAAGIGYLCFLNLREKNMGSHQWFIYGVLVALILPVSALLLPMSPSTIAFLVLAPGALLYTFSSFKGSGQKEIASFITLIAVGVLSLYLYGSFAFVSSVIFVVTYNVAMITHVFYYDAKKLSVPQLSKEVAKTPAEQLD